MKPSITRRKFVGATATAALAGSLGAQADAAQAAQPRRLKIVGVSCSPRQGMTTSTAVRAALDAAAEVDPRIEVELIDLGGLDIAGWSPQPVADDFEMILPKLRDAAVAGLILGSPSYFRGMTSLCKAFIERCGPLREPAMLLDGKPLGAIATGGFRNGGQELVIDQIHAAMMCFGMLPVGGRAPAHLGGTLVSADNRIDADDLGLATARKTGARVADFALKFAGRGTDD